MAEYKVSFTVEGSRIDSVKKRIAGLFPEEEAQVEKTNVSTSRADRLRQAESLVEEAKSIIEELTSEMENWRDSLPENLQGGEKASQIEETISQLEELQNALEGADFSAIDFPGMMG